MLVVASGGGQYVKAAFNDYIDTYDNDRIVFGSRMQNGVVITQTASLSVQMPAALVGETARGVAITVSPTSRDFGDDPIAVNLYSDFLTTRTLRASASLPGVHEVAFKEVFAEFYPYVPLTGSDYWLTFNPISGSMYKVGLDTSSTIQTLYKFGSTTATGSINGGVVLLPFVRMGTNYQGTVTVRVMAKNSSERAFELADLVGRYITLGKHAQIDRTAAATDGLLPAMLVADSVGELTEKAITIRDVRVGQLEMKPRGDNDRIFIVTVSIDVFAEWHQDFIASSIKDITETISSFT